jgi:hypothetical protein
MDLASSSASQFRNVCEDSFSCSTFDFLDTGIVAVLSDFPKV